MIPLQDMNPLVKYLKQLPSNVFAFPDGTHYTDPRFKRSERKPDSMDQRCNKCNTEKCNDPFGVDKREGRNKTKYVYLCCNCFYEQFPSVNKEFDEYCNNCQT